MSDSPPSPAPSRLRRAIQAALGLALIALFFSLDRLQHGLEITFHHGFTNSSPGELYFWLGSILLLGPGFLLLGLAAQEPLAAAGRAARTRLDGLNPGEIRLVGLLLVLGFAVLYRLLRLVVLSDYYVSDDEYGVRFGGQVWATGHLMAPLPVAKEFTPVFYLHLRDGLAASMDFMVQIGVAALALVTRLGAWTYALLAALTALAVARVAGRLGGRAAAVAAPLLFLCSPMALSLSITEHPQLVSRCLIAWSIWHLLRARDGGPARLLIAGAALGLSALSRPFETIMLMSPLALATCVAGRDRPTALRRLALLVAGALPALLILLAYNTHLTGAPWLLPRFFYAPFKEEVPGLWDRWGNNVGYNTVLLSIWFLGPLGILLALFGASRNATARLLVIGVGVNLLGGLLHDDWGMHLVGPIHYSESAVCLAIAAALGLRHLPAWARGHHFNPRPLLAGLLALLVGGGLVFGAWHLRALQIMVRPQVLGYGVLDEQLRNAVVLAPRFEQVWKTIPALRRYGSWVFAWRGVSPRADENVVILNDIEGAAAEARRAFPQRSLHRLSITPEPPYLILRPLGPDER
jgi:4-amino-4-deoxy-L-arabinose transferase-like glycosyltransferase